MKNIIGKNAETKQSYWAGTNEYRILADNLHISQCGFFVSALLFLTYAEV